MIDKTRSERGCLQLVIRTYTYILECGLTVIETITDRKPVEFFLVEFRSSSSRKNIISFSHFLCYVDIIVFFRNNTWGDRSTVRHFRIGLKCSQFYTRSTSNSLVSQLLLRQSRSTSTVQHVKFFPPTFSGKLEKSS